MPYQPNATDQRGQIIMQGLQMGQQSQDRVAQIAEYFMNRGNQAKSLRTMLGTYNPELKPALEGMGVDQLEGLVHGISMKAQTDMNVARMKDYAAQAAQREQLAADDAPIGLAANRYATMPGVSTGQDVSETEPTPGSTAGTGTTGGGMRPPTADERFRYALATPGLSGRAVPRLIDVLAKYGQMSGDQTPVVMKDNPYPGVALVTTKGGRGGVRVVTDPSVDVKPTFFKPTDTPVQDLPGLEDRVRVVTGPNTSEVMPKAAGGTTKPMGPADVINLHAQKIKLMEQMNNPVINNQMPPEVKRAYQDTMEQIDGMIKQYKGDSSAASGLPLPTDKKSMVTGKVYQTNRGPAKWDGEMLQLVK